jgi:hypothetical protein
MDAHDYSDRIEAKGNFSAQNRSRGNENRRWHGTKRRCYIGDDGETEPCSDPLCYLCGIIKNSFDIACSYRNRNFKRFGVGIYTSSTSSKFVPQYLSSVLELLLNNFLRAHDYSKNGFPSDWKGLLLSKVVAGRGCKLTTDQTSLTSPPPGFDSVSVIS